MTLIEPQIRLFAFLLRYYLQSRDQWLGIVDKELADIFCMRFELVRNEYQHGWISESERDSEWVEIDREISEWQRRLDDWHAEKFYLGRFLDELRNHLREQNYASAA